MKGIFFALTRGLIVISDLRRRFGGLKIMHHIWKPNHCCLNIVLLHKYSFFIYINSFRNIWYTRVVLYVYWYVLYVKRFSDVLLHLQSSSLWIWSCELTSSNLLLFFPFATSLRPVKGRGIFEKMSFPFDRTYAWHTLIIYGTSHVYFRPN